MSGKDKEERAKRRGELRERLDEMDTKISEMRILAGQLEAKKRAALQKKVEELEGEIAAGKANAFTLETKLSQQHATVRQLVEASNAASILLSSVERFLDREYGDDWDEGIRKETEARAALLKRRKDIIIESHKAKEMTPEHRCDLAAELWEISTELQTKGADVAMVISLYLQSREVNAALDVVEVIHREKVQLAPEVAQVVQQLVDRCRDLAAEQKDEVQGARVERVPTIVDPSGNPISSS